MREDFPTNPNSFDNLLIQNPSLAPHPTPPQKKKKISHHPPTHREVEKGEGRRGQKSATATQVEDLGWQGGEDVRPCWFDSPYFFLIDSHHKNQEPSLSDSQSLES